MGPPETSAQCLCPLSQGIGNGDSIAKGKALVDNSLSNESLTDTFSHETATKPKQSELLPLSSQATSLLRRLTSTTFYDGGDAQQCIDACRQGFFESGLSSLSLSSYSSPVSLSGACSLLSSDTAAQKLLWQLYWCDSAFCGVWINHSGGKGQDPNVDLIINQCQNIGYPSIYDPGPPPPSYYCSSLLAAGPSSNPCRNLVAVATETVTSAASFVKTMEPGTTLITQHRSNHQSQHLTTAPAPDTTATLTTTGRDVSSAVGTMGSTATDSDNNKNDKITTAAVKAGGPSAGAKGAIVACIVVLVLLIAGILFFFFRQRRSNMLAQSYQHRDGGDREGGGGPSRHRPSRASAAPVSIGFTTRLRHQGQMLFNPGHGRGGASSGIPTPLISPANSCNSDRGVPLGLGYATSNSVAPKDGRATFFASLRSPRSPADHLGDSPTPKQPFRLLPFFFTRRSGDRSVSPPLTSLSPPPSPTQMSPRGRHDMDSDRESDGGNGFVGKNENRVSAANSGSSYYGYYGYNGHFVPYYFPSSPICAPTTNKLEPRREWTPTIRPSKQDEPGKQQRYGYCSFQSSWTTDGGSPVPPFPTLPSLPISIFSSQAIANGQLDISSQHLGPRSSYGSYSTASSTVVPASNLYGNAVTTNFAEHMTPLKCIPALPSLPLPIVPSPAAALGVSASPVRPKRPQETPFEIHEFVMPESPWPSLFHHTHSHRNISDRNLGMRGQTMSSTTAGYGELTPGNGARTPPRGPLASRQYINIATGRAPPPGQSLSPPPPPPSRPTGAQTTEACDARKCIESLSLPPLPVRDDNNDDKNGKNKANDDKMGNGTSTWSTSIRQSSEKYHPTNNSQTAKITASFSSTTSTASILSSSMAETVMTGTTVTSSLLTSLSTARQPCLTSSQLPPQRLFYHGAPSTTSSVLTILPAAATGPLDKETKDGSRDDAVASDALFPSHAVLDVDEM